MKEELAKEEGNNDCEEKEPEKWLGKRLKNVEKSNLVINSRSIYIYIYLFFLKQLMCSWGYQVQFSYNSVTCSNTSTTLLYYGQLSPVALILL